jgi:histidinol dehydrogenase
VRCETLSLAPGGAERMVVSLRELIPAREHLAERVAEILASVRREGDRALADYTSRLDTGGAPARPARVPDALLDEALAGLAGEVRAGLELAAANVRRVAEASVLGAEREVDFGSHRVGIREVPVRRAAVYVPGGRAPYPSTVVMGLTCARVAGVEHVAVCSPPRPDGELHPAVLAACRLGGADAVYRIGGAQAVAALAWGTESVAAVDLLVGPGNLWVQEAKRQAFGQVGIDGFAGPSDLLVIADPDAAPEPVALDLLAQAEHGPGTLVIAASPAGALLQALPALIEAGPDSEAICRLVALPSEDEGLELAQAFGPEHLQLIGPRSEALARRVTRAGCVFVGAAAGTAFGDYVAGSNHVLPTDGAARFASALSARSFRRSQYELRIDDPAGLARAAAPLARAEGFELHARSMEARLPPEWRR